MKLKLNAQALLRQITVISELVPPTNGLIAFQVDGKLNLYSMNDVATYKSTVPCDVAEGKEKFGVPLQALKTAISGRKDITMDFQNNTLIIKEAKYQCDLATTEAVEIEAIESRETKLENPKEWKVSAEQSKWLYSACSEVNLHLVEALNPYMPLAIKVTDKGAFVACYDNNHMAFIRSKSVTGDLDLTMPADLLTSVFKSFAGSPFKMQVTEQQVIIQSKLLNICCNLPVSDSYIDVASLMSVAMKALKSSGNIITTDRAAFCAFMDSCKAVATKERSELHITGSDVLKLQVKTVNGTVAQSLPNKNKVKVDLGLDFLYVEEAVKKSNDPKLDIRVMDSSVMIGSKNGHTIISVFA